MINATWGHRLALTGGLGLLALWLYWVVILAAFPPAARAPVLALSSLPILFNLRGLMHDRRNSYVWLGLISLGYFIHGVSAAVTESARLTPSLEAALSLCLFVGCLIRLRSA